ncbi:MAG TPA: VOC family protein [Candidatus Dormibacteraeota bacterium]|jgi:methylmalonyl-CoA/ethylmalonyl-CoA epimerase
MLKRIDHVGVVVDDLDRVSEFFTGVLGLELVRSLEDAERHLRARFFRSGDADVEIIELGDPEARAQRLGSAQARIDHIAFEVDDLSGTVVELGAGGVRMATAEPRRAGAMSTIFSEPGSTMGVVLQLLERS